MALNEKTPAVYMFRCKINNKVYIGSTKDIGRRMKQWLYEYHTALDKNPKRDTPLVRDMVKYGWDNFEFKIIDSSPDMFDPDTRSILEIELIVKYQSILPEYGYNSTIGGESGANKHRKTAINRKPKSMFVYDTVTDRLWFHFKGTKTIPKQLACRKDLVPDAASRGKMVKKRYFLYYANTEHRKTCMKYIKDLKEHLPENGGNKNISKQNYTIYKIGYELVNKYAEELGIK